jgi:hypothetical protein
MLPVKYALLHPALLIEASGWFGYKRIRSNYYHIDKIGNGFVKITTSASYRYSFNGVLELAQDKRKRLLKRISDKKRRITRKKAEGRKPSLNLTKKELFEIYDDQVAEIEMMKTGFKALRSIQEDVALLKEEDVTN